jgi:hypothetical protein
VTIPPDIEAQILRYYHAERWRVGTIAKQLRVHRDPVARVLAQAGLPHLDRPPRPSKIDPYLPFIHETLTKFPTLRASRLLVMVQERGIAADQASSAISLPATGHGRRRRPIYGCGPWPANRPRSIGGILAIW